MLVEGWLARAAAARPRHPAVETPAGSCSYEELLTAARVGARHLAECGVGPGDRVAIALSGGLPFAQALHACLELGAVAMPLDVRSTARERDQLAAGAALLLDGPLPTGVLKPARGDQRAPALPQASTHDLGAVAVVVHTSGTGLSPRAVELTYANLLWSAIGSAVALELDPGERWLCALPVAHVGGLSILVRAAIYATTAVVHERFEADRVLDAVARQGITLVSLVATTLSRLLDEGLERPPALRCALTGGGPVPAALLGRAAERQIPVSLTYGLTEAASQVTTTPVGLLRTGVTVPGPPLFCTRVRIADSPDTDGVGEVLIAGPTVAPAAVASEGWLHTGDLGSFDHDGRLQITGRKVDTIISGGENVAPSEVEAALEEHPDVLEAAVVGRADERWGEALTAIVVPRRGRTPSPQELRAHCARLLAAYKVPKQISLREQPLPRTPSGKLVRRKLR